MKNGNSNSAQLYQMAKEFDEVLTAMCAASTAMLSFITMSKAELSLAETIHYQTGALDLLDDIKTYFPIIQGSLPKLQKQIIAIQGQATEAATEESER